MKLQGDVLQHTAAKHFIPKDHNKEAAEMINAAYI